VDNRAICPGFVIVSREDHRDHLEAFATSAPNNPPTCGPVILEDKRMTIAGIFLAWLNRPQFH
jgi:hypothetical protein